MARRSSGFHPITVAVDMNGVTRRRRLDERTDVEDVVMAWLDAYPTNSTYALGNVAVGEIEILGSSFVMEYEFRDEAFAEAFRTAFREHVLSPTLWASYEGLSQPQPVPAP